MIPGMPPMQVSASSSASATSKGGDGAFGGSNSAMIQGDWNISNGQGGVTTSSSNMLAYAALGLAALWITRRKA